MRVVEEIRLSNGLVLQVRDRSRLIATDTTKVELEIAVPVEVRDEYFENSRDCDLVKHVFGPEIVFTVRKERAFVKNEDRASLFSELLDGFKRDSLPYLERPSFPICFIHSRLADIRRRPHRYPAVSAYLSDKG